VCVFYCSFRDAKGEQVRLCNLPSALNAHLEICPLGLLSCQVCGQCVARGSFPAHVLGENVSSSPLSSPSSSSLSSSSSSQQSDHLMQLCNLVEVFFFFFKSSFAIDSLSFSFSSDTTFSCSLFSHLLQTYYPHAVRFVNRDSNGKSTAYLGDCRFAGNLSCIHTHLYFCSSASFTPFRFEAQCGQDIITSSVIVFSRLKKLRPKHSRLVCICPRRSHLPVHIHPLTCDAPLLTCWRRVVVTRRES
jgi:hypothetical protein